MVFWRANQQVRILLVSNKSREEFYSKHVVQDIPKCVVEKNAASLFRFFFPGKRKIYEAKYVIITECRSLKNMLLFSMHEHSFFKSKELDFRESNLMPRNFECYKCTFLASGIVHYLGFLFHIFTRSARATEYILYTRHWYKSLHS